jgi:hypothetical protein
MNELLSVNLTIFILGFIQWTDKLGGGKIVFVVGIQFFLNKNWDT